MRIANLVRGTVVVALALVPLALPQATTANFVASVTRTMATSNDAFGGCMVQLDKSPNSEGLNCEQSGNWVTFSCSGEYVASRADALRMLDSAQLAFVTGRQVRLWVDDERQHNGFCFVYRIDVLAQ